MLRLALSLRQRYKCVGSDHLIFYGLEFPKVDAYKTELRMHSGFISLYNKLQLHIIMPVLFLLTTHAHDQFFLGAGFIFDHLEF